MHSAALSSSVTFAGAPRRVPGAGERAFRVRGQITLGSRLLFRGESRATTARIHVVLRAAAAVAATTANESRCAGPSHLGQTLRHSVSRSPGHAFLQARSPV